MCFVPNFTFRLPELCRIAGDTCIDKEPSDSELCRIVDSIFIDKEPSDSKLCRIAGDICIDKETSNSDYVESRAILFFFRKRTFGFRLRYFIGNEPSDSDIILL
jgi:hypothetical protein